MQTISKKNRRRKKFILFTITFSLLLIVVFYIWSSLQLPGIKERLAAIEAVRAIPDSENAAILYEKLLIDPRMELFDYDPSSLKDGSEKLDFIRPWSTEDFPEFAGWINKNQWLIDELIKISQYEKCRFPINIDIYNALPIDRISMIRNWTYLLAHAANNDVGEGRIDYAIEKWRCISRMADHFYQQTTTIEIIMGISLDQLTIGQLAVSVVTCNLDENHLKKIEKLPLLRTHDNWKSILKIIKVIDELEELKLKQGFSFVDHLKFEFTAWRFKKDGIDVRPDDVYGDTRFLYSRILASRRGIRILTALRRYKYLQGIWPDSLERICTGKPAELFIDPLNKASFVYKFQDDSFKLYSKGENKIDEDGQYKTDGPDDWPIWPPRGYRTQSESSKNK